MKFLRIITGLWLQVLILGILRLVGFVAVVHGSLQGLYRTSLVRKPICTATVLHLVLLALLLAALGWAGARLAG
jgi:hypothetical protein